MVQNGIDITCREAMDGKGSAGEKSVETTVPRKAGYLRPWFRSDEFKSECSCNGAYCKNRANRVSHVPDPPERTDFRTYHPIVDKPTGIPRRRGVNWLALIAG